MKIIAFAFFCLLAAPSILPAQTGCYGKIREDGERLLRQKKYGEAINQFWTALATCTDVPKNHDLDKLIQSAQASWVGELQTSAEREKQAAESERIARQQAETAEQAAKSSQQIAEQKEREAITEGRRAESLRLSLLADNLRQKGQLSDALWVAFLSRQLAGINEQALPALMRSFAEAVRDSFSVTFFDAPTHIRSLRFFQDGKKVVLQLEDESVWMLDIDQRKQTKLLESDERQTGLITSDSGKLLLTWRADGSAQLWDEAGKLKVTLAQHTEPIRTAAFSYDEKWVVTGSRDNTARLWRISDGVQTALLAGHTGNVYEVLFSPDNQWILTRSSDGSAMTWDLNGNKIGVLGQGHIYLHDCAVSSTGEIALGAASGELLISDEKGVAKASEQAQKGNAPVTAVSFLSGSEHLLVTSGGMVSVYSRNGQLLTALPHPAPVSGWAISAKNNRFLTWTNSLNDPYSVRIWDEKGALQRNISLPQKALVGQIRWSPDGLFLLATLRDRTVYLMDAEGNILTEWLGNSTESAYVPPAIFSPDGEQILTAGTTRIALSRSPHPERIFRRMQNEFNPGAAFVRGIVNRFSIRFFPN
jgi:WD40 repeat protein